MATLETRLRNLATATGTQVKALRTLINCPPDLTIFELRA